MSEQLQSLQEALNLIVDQETVRQMMDELPDAILVVDGSGLIKLVNKETELLFGYVRTEILGKRFEIFLPEEVRERHAQYFAQYFQAPSRRPMNFARPLQGRRKDGALIPLQILLSPLITPSGIWAQALIRRVTNHGAA